MVFSIFLKEVCLIFNLFPIYEYLVWIDLCVTYAFSTQWARRGYQIPQNWAYRQLYAAVRAGDYIRVLPS